MSSFDVSKKIKGDKEIDSDAIKYLIKDHLTKTCKLKTTPDAKEPFSIAGRVKETLLTPVVKFNALFSIKTEGDKARISVTGNSSAFWPFWVLIVLGLLTGGVTSLVAFILYFVQRNKPKEMCESILNAIDTEFGTI